MFYRVVNVVGALVLSIVASTNVVACLCMGDQTVCDAYGVSEVIVVGTITKVTDAKNRNTASPFVDGQDLTIDVHKVYKGTAGRSLELWQPFSSCNAKFDDSVVGKRLLLYLERQSDPERLSLRVCGRSRFIDSASGDISWLDKLPGSLNRSYFSGVIDEFTEIDDDGKPLDRRKWKGFVGNVYVYLSNGTRSFKTRSNSSGSYELWDIPKGRYRFNADFSSTFKVDDYYSNGYWDYTHPNLKNELWFEIDGKGCGGVDYYLIKRP